MGAIYGSSYYTIVDGPTWEEAEANAVKLGGHLVTINDSNESAFLSSNPLKVDFTSRISDYSIKMIHQEPTGNGHQGRN